MRRCWLICSAPPPPPCPPSLSLSRPQCIPFLTLHQIQTVADAKEQLEKQCEEWKAKIEKTLKEQEERFKEDDKKYADEINSLKKENQAKKIQLENCCLVKK